MEQAAFEPGNLPPGLGASPDRMLQVRLFSYPDAHRYRIGSNYAAVQTRLIEHIVAVMQDVPQEIQIRQISHFMQADRVYDEGLAKVWASH